MSNIGQTYSNCFGDLGALAGPAIARLATFHTVRIPAMATTVLLDMPQPLAAAIRMRPLTSFAPSHENL
eukprot:4425244-Amphidinium_carterae.1